MQREELAIYICSLIRIILPAVKLHVVSNYRTRTRLQIVNVLFEYSDLKQSYIHVNISMINLYLFDNCLTTRTDMFVTCFKKNKTVSEQ